MSPIQRWVGILARRCRRFPQPESIVARLRWVSKTTYLVTSQDLRTVATPRSLYLECLLAAYVLRSASCRPSTMRAPGSQGHDARRQSGRTGPCRAVVWTPPSTQKRADVPEGRNVSGEPPGEFAPWAPSTGTCSLRPSARASRTPWRRRTDAPRNHPAGSVRASGTCARSRVSR